MQTDKNRQSTRVAVSIVGYRADHILLARRHNSGYMDGYWSLVAGHVFEREPPSQAIIREVHEECGLLLAPHELQLVGSMHLNSNPFDYCNYVYKVDLSDKIIINNEPDKCAELSFFALDRLPEPLIDHTRYIIEQSFAQTPWIAEYGW